MFKTQPLVSRADTSCNGEQILTEEAQSVFESTPAPSPAAARFSEAVVEEVTSQSTFKRSRRQKCPGLDCDCSPASRHRAQDALTLKCVNVFIKPLRGAVSCKQIQGTFPRHDHHQRPDRKARGDR